MLAGQTVNNIFSFMRSAINRAVATGMWSGVNPLSTKGGTWKREEVKSLLDGLETVSYTHLTLPTTILV